MALRPEIALGGQLPQTPDLIGGAAQVMRLRDMRDIAAMRGLQRQQAELELANMQRDRLIQEGRRSAVVMTPDGQYDRAATIRNLTRLGDFQGADTFTDNWAKQDEQAAKAREQQLKASEKYNSLFGQAAQWVKSQGNTQQAYDAAKQHLVAIGVPAEIVGRAPEAVDPAYIDGIIQSTLTEGDRLNRDKYNRDLTLPVSDIGKIQYDEDRYLAQGGRFGPPPAPPVAPATQPGGPIIQANSAPPVLPEPDATTGGIKTGARNPFAAARNRVSFGQAPDGFRWSDEGNLVALPEYWEKKGKSEGTNVKNEGSLRDDFNKASKDWVLQRDAFSRIRTSAANPSAAGDLALIFNYMKLLDPGSTVREGEFATAQNSAGVDDRVRSWYNRLVKGERLAPDQRADFVGRAGMLYNAALRNQKTIEAQYMDIANRYGMDPRNVVINYRDTSPEEGATAPRARDDLLPAAPGGPKPAAPQATPRISSDAEFKALPSGSLFIAPDGTTRRKP